MADDLRISGTENAKPYSVGYVCGAALGLFGFASIGHLRTCADTFRLPLPTIAAPNRSPIVSACRREKRPPRSQCRPTFDKFAEVEESLTCEFKEVAKGQSPIQAIGKIMDRYAVAFLNETSGSVFWGIRDDRRVMGVELNAKGGR